MSPQHQKYVDNLSTHFVRWLKRNARPLCPVARQAAIILMHLDLGPAREMLDSLYSYDPRGQKPIDPILMLRGLILMILMKVESIPRWAEKLKTDKRLAQIVGFDPKKTPVAGAFYHFIDRLEDGEYQKPSASRVKPSKRRKGKHLRHLSNEKQQREADSKQAVEEYDSVTQKLSDELISAQNTPRPKDLQSRLEDLLIKCAVIPSAKMGLLGDLSKLTIAGDGSSLTSGASGNGKRSCKCRSDGILSCDCPRYYTDPTANWGRDTYRGCYYFGHTFYQHTVNTSGHDLPVHIGIGPASETDFTLSLKSANRFKKALVENGLDWSIQHAIYDAGHDAIGIYSYLAHYDITPIIALNNRSKTPPTPTGTAVHLNERGVPLCRAGIEMRRHTLVKSRHRLIYNCPVKRPTHKEGKTVFVTHPNECPIGVLCQPETKMGPTVYLRTDTDPRLHPPIARDSEKFKKLMNLRSGCERSNSMKKVAYRLGRRVCRNATHFLVRLVLASIIEHARVWAEQAISTIGDSHKRFTKWLQSR